MLKIDGARNGNLAAAKDREVILSRVSTRCRTGIVQSLGPHINTNTTHCITLWYFGEHHSCGARGGHLNNLQ